MTTLTPQRLDELIEAIRVLGFWRHMYLRFAYRHIMRLAHRFNWHYAPPIYPEGDTQLWCKWCGMRYPLPAPYIEGKDHG